MRKLMLFTGSGMLIKFSQSNLFMNILLKMIVVSAIRGFGRQKSQLKLKLYMVSGERCYSYKRQHAEKELA
jgi:hypothetical protein